MLLGLSDNHLFHQNKVASDSALIFLEWMETADFYFNYNSIDLADDLSAYLFENGGRDIKSGNLSCHANALLPNKELICPKDTDLYERVKRGFQISDTPVEDIVLDNVESCKETDAKHCQTINDEDTYKHVVIEVTKFTDFKSSDNGGAVYLVNTGVLCVDATYSRCSSTEKGGGGAIFLYNNENDIDFIGVKINSCSAAFGGGAYVYSKCKDTLVTFKGCTFKGNKAKSSGSDDFFGGGAIYMTVAAARLCENIFSNNKGGILKINEKCMEKQKSSKVLSVGSSIITIVDCKFESESEEKMPSILFLNSKDKIF